MPTQAGANLTALASDEPDGNVYIAGFGDGVVRLFDKRSHAAEQAIIHIWRKHHTWIQSVHIQRSGLKEIITGRLVVWPFLPVSRSPADLQHERRSPNLGCPKARCAVVRRSGPAPRYDGARSALRCTRHGFVSPLQQFKIALTPSTSAPAGHSTKQRLLIQGFSHSSSPKTLSTIGIPLTPSINTPHRPSGFMPSASSLVFHPVSA